MITKIINISEQLKFYDVSEAVDFAKGSRKTPKTWCELMNYFKRNASWRKRLF